MVDTVKQFLNSDIFFWVILPALIFIARICDVTIGTLRIIFVSRGKKLWAPLLGFFEVMIWLIAIGQIMKNLNNPLCYLAYAAGYATGNFVGITIEETLAMGIMVIRIFTNSHGENLVENLKAAGYGVTIVDGRGATGPVNVIYTIIKRSALPEVDRIVKTFNPKAFYTIEDVKAVNQGVFPIKDNAAGFIRFLKKK